MNDNNAISWYVRAFMYGFPSIAQRSYIGEGWDVIFVGIRAPVFSRFLLYLYALVNRLVVHRF